MLLLSVAAALLLVLAIPVAARAEDAPSTAGGAAAGDEEPADPSAGATDDDEDDEPEQGEVEVTCWFLKTDESSVPLAGARVELRGASGEVLRTFETGEEEAELTQTLAVDETYTLHEVAAPAGYALADDLPFVVELDEEGEPCVVGQGADVRSKDDSMLVMADAKLEPLLVGKRDAKGKPLSGAKLTLWDMTLMAEVETWTSTDEEHEVAAELLRAGHAYCLVENEAPGGYEPCEPIDFALGRDGSVSGSWDKAAAYDGKARTLLVTDEPEPEDPKDPEEPNESEDPTEPTDPTDPSQPADPVAPKPTPKTTDPAKPTAPKPVTSASTPQPTAPSAQASKTSAGSPDASSANAASDLPQTGDGASPWVVVLPVVGACVLAAGLWSKFARR